MCLESLSANLGFPQFGNHHFMKMDTWHLLEIRPIMASLMSLTYMDVINMFEAIMVMIMKTYKIVWRCVEIYKPHLDVLVYRLMTTGTSLPMGLLNYGMTCFASAVLQCMLHAPGLSKRLEAEPAYTPDALDTLLMTGYCEQRANTEASLLGGRLAELVFGGRADEMDQGDTDELLLKCLEQSERNHGRTAKHFTATFFCLDTCSECRWELPGSYVKFESFRIECNWNANTCASSISELLYSNIGRHYAPTPPPPHNCNHSFDPPEGSGVLSARYFSGILPECLALFMQRFKYREVYGIYEGYIDDRSFDVCEKIELWELNLDAHALPHKRVYTLYGLIKFRGSDNHGHYISYISSNGTWYRMDDTYVRAVEESDVFTHSPGEIVTYAFYSKE